MLLDFKHANELGINNLNGGSGTVFAKMFAQPNLKILCSRLPKGASIGLHTHLTSCEINFVLSGSGTAVCDNIPETLSPGACHYCPKGSAHSIANTGADDLVLFTVVPEC